MYMLKIGVLGAGHLGKIHIKLLLELKDAFNLVGFYDPNEEVRSKVSEELSVKSFDDMDALMDEVDVLDVVTPTLSHYECSSAAIKKGKHVFIEKPITETTEEARSLMALAEEAGVKVQVGHVERFNPAFQAAAPHLFQPLFIETHRLAQFNPRGTDVPVVLDLMIHDLDIILSVVKSSLRKVSASGVAVVSDTPDIANARLEFDNGCVANLTASRISLKNMRKSRFFQKDAYISVDFLEKTFEMVQMQDVHGEPDPFDMVLDLGEGKPAKKISIEKPEIAPSNAILEELRSFYEAIVKDVDPQVTISDGCLALEVAHQILDKLKVNGNLIGENI